MNIKILLSLLLLCLLCFYLGFYLSSDYETGVKHGLSQCYPYLVPHAEAIEQGCNQ